MWMHRQGQRRSGLIGAALVAGAIAASMAGSVAGTAHAAGGIIISEVAPWGSGNSPYAADWFEVTNTSGAAVSIAGWTMDDNSNSFAASVALNGVSSIAAGESVVFVETPTPATTVPAFKAAWFGSTPPALQVGTYSGSGVGLGTGGDAVNLFSSTGVVQANVSFGGSPSTPPFASFDNAAGIDNATISTLSVAGVQGAFLVPTPAAQAAIGGPGTIAGGSTPPSTTSTTSTPSASSTTSTSSTTTTTIADNVLPWPGDQAVSDASTYTFGGNLSGLIEEGSGTAAPGTLWAVRNGPGALFRLVRDGTNWAPDTSNGWSAGKALHYADGSGDPDAEGVTFAGPSSANGIFVSTERNNLASGVSRLSVLRFDPTATGTSLNANMEWNLTADLPPVGPNLGLEAITWVPDSYLVGNSFYDEHNLHTYTPADYSGHGSGLFFVGLEGNGMIYAYALDQTNGSFTRVATIASTFPAIMELQFDRDLNQLWAVCDNTCNGQHALLRIDPAGRFAIVAKFDRPTGMPNYNNEGFAIAPATECVNNRKPVDWADDGEDLGVAIRSGNIPCTAVDAPPVDVPEFPVAALPTVMALGLVGMFITIARRRQRSVTA